MCIVSIEDELLLRQTISIIYLSIYHCPEHVVSSLNTKGRAVKKRVVSAGKRLYEVGTQNVVALRPGK